jgi:hypothetical protein
MTKHGWFREPTYIRLTAVQPRLTYRVARLCQEPAPGTHDKSVHAVCRLVCRECAPETTTKVAHAVCLAIVVSSHCAHDK